MKQGIFTVRHLAGIASLLLGITSTVNHACAREQPASSEPIPWSEFGATAQAQYQGDGLSIVPTETGALLRCVFQRLEAEATSDGLWITSTAPDAARDRFRVMASTVERVKAGQCVPPAWAKGELFDEGFPLGPDRRDALPYFGLPRTGSVQVASNLVRFIRPGLIEEYSVSLDGIRQDFVILERPDGVGELRVELDVTGARAEQADYGARLILENSGRKIAYSRLHVVDATGRELPARIEVASYLVSGIEFAPASWTAVGVGWGHTPLSHGTARSHLSDRSKSGAAAAALLA